MNKPIFYNKVRSTVFGGALKVTQVDGLELILAEADRRSVNNEFLAYILATTAWETGHTMQPVAEAFWVKNAEAWRKKNLRYYPFYGRGYVQLTWDFNYRKATDYFVKVLGIKVDFVKNPDLVMRPEYAVVILFQGMLDGWFTTKRLSTYLDGLDGPDGVDQAQFKAARRIINGTDKDDEIAALALKFERALRTSERPEGGVKLPEAPVAPPVVPVTPAPPVAPPVAPAPPAEAPTAPKENVWLRLLRIFTKAFA